MPNMLLHSGASLHRHEYSPSMERSIPTTNRSYLPHSQFTQLSPVRRSSTISGQPTSIIRRPGRSLSDVSLRTYEHTVRFQDLDGAAMDGDDGKSIATSESSETTKITKVRRRSSKGLSSFQFAYSAPTQLRKQRLLQVRPRKLLQLHHLPPGSRPVPIVDVLTSMVVVPRLVKRFPRMFRGKGELGANDVMIVRSETYDSQDSRADATSDSDEENLSNRELLAVICQARRDLGGSIGRAEIVLSDESVWSATPISKDSFEFVNIDDTGKKTTARWVRKSSRAKKADLAVPVDPLQEPQFSFSIIAPGTRKHPIMATLIPNNLKIYHSYTPISTSPDASASTSPVSAPPMVFSPETSARKPGRLSIQIDEKLRALIQITAIWVGLRKGWCPHFRYNDVPTTSNSSCPRGAPDTVSRSMSVSVLQDTKARPQGQSGSPDPLQSSLSGIGDKMKRSYILGSPQSTVSAFEASPRRPSRTVSTGSAFMQRNAARRGYSYPSFTNGSEAGPVLSTLIPDQLDIDGESGHSTPQLSSPNLHDPLSSSSAMNASSQRDAFSNGVTVNNKSSLQKHYPDVITHEDQLDVKEKRRLSRWKTITSWFRGKQRSR